MLLEPEVVKELPEPEEFAQPSLAPGTTSFPQGQVVAVQCARAGFLFALSRLACGCEWLIAPLYGDRGRAL
ncbi:MAG: hypothetical protein ACI8X5_003275 [Planctomycetota bacterium]|jgi:hypothetical protein